MSLEHLLAEIIKN